MKHFIMISYEGQKALCGTAEKLACTVRELSVDNNVSVVCLTEEQALSSIAMRIDMMMTPNDNHPSTEAADNALAVIGNLFVNSMVPRFDSARFTAECVVKILQNDEMKQTIIASLEVLADENNKVSFQYAKRYNFNEKVRKACASVLRAVGAAQM